MKIHIYGKKKLLLAFEYGVILAKVAQERGVEIDHAFMVRAEEMVAGEFGTQNIHQLAKDMTMNIVSAFNVVDEVPQGEEE